MNDMTISAAPVADVVGQPLLSVRDVHSFYGNIEALKGVSLDVQSGEIVTLIGANGAGKTTLLQNICGKPMARSGHIRFEGRELVGHPPFETARLGIAISPEGRHVFARMTVFENLQMGATVTDGTHFDADLAHVFGLFPILRSRRAQRAGTMSGGEQQMLAIGRALMARPKLLLLDEPSLGLAPLIVREIFEVIAEVNRQGTTVFLVEQNAHQALSLAHRGYVMQTGRIILSGTGAELLANSDVRAAYLDGGH